MVNGTHAVVPMDVPTTMRVNGMIATITDDKRYELKVALTMATLYLVLRFPRYDL